MTLHASFALTLFFECNSVTFSCSHHHCGLLLAEDNHHLQYFGSLKMVGAKQCLSLRSLSQRISVSLQCFSLKHSLHPGHRLGSNTRFELDTGERDTCTDMDAIVLSCYHAHVHACYHGDMSCVHLL